MSARKLLLVSGVLVAALIAAAAIKLSARKPTLAQAVSAVPSAEPRPAGARTAVPLVVAETVYSGKLAAGWDDWGWGPHDLNNGPARIVFGNYGGIIFHHAPLDANIGAVSFRYRADAGAPEFLAVSLKGAGGGERRLPNVPVEARHVALLPDGWREVLVDLSELDPDRLSFDRIVISAALPVKSDWVLIDNVVLVKPSEVSSEAPLRHNVQLAISCRKPTHPIDPAIYGSAQGDWASGQTGERVGGNPTTRFNWDLGVWNIANDWYFENTKAVDLHQILDNGSKRGSPTAVTVPIIGWVAKDSVSVGFPRAKFAQQRKFDPYRAEAGDGHRADGSMITPGPPTQTSVAASPELIGRWIAALRNRDRANGTHSVQMYILDNEPSLWNETHHDVHPEPLGYDELLDRTLRYATAIRKADPDARIAGPAEWGYLGYLYSARDRAAGTEKRPDRLAHGDMPLIPWYLQRIAEQEKAKNIRLLDILDVHFYPAAKGLYGENARTDPEGAALRLRATRALWDPSYKDESWIGEPIRLIPRLKDWVATYDPGLRVSLGEWSFGGDNHISGALATAEALGRFGQQGLDAAYYWDGPKAGSATFWAFRAFRNFDGQGARFQDLSLVTEETGNVSLFASRNPDGSKIVAVLVNRNPNVVVSTELKLDGCGRVASRRVFRYVSGSSSLLAEPPGTLDGSRLTESLPPYSLTVIDLDITH